MISQENGKAICPESTLESANRRNFIRKAALTSAAAGIGSTILAGNVLPQTSASSDGRVIACCGGSPCGDAVIGTSKAKGGSGVVGLAMGAAICAAFPSSGVYGQSCKGCSYGVIGFNTCQSGKAVGVYGHSNSKCGIGVSGYASEFNCGKSTGVYGESSSYSGYGVVGCSPNIGVCGTGSNAGVKANSSNVGLCVNGCKTGVKVTSINVGLCVKACKIGVHVCSPGCCGVGIASNSSGPCSIGVIGESTGPGSTGVWGEGKLSGVSGLSPYIGVCGSGGKIGVLGQSTCVGGVPIVAKGYPGQTANLQQWENSCGTVYAVINKAGSLGLGGVTSPPHVLSISGKAWASDGFIIGPNICTPNAGRMLAMNGSMAVKARCVSSSGNVNVCDYGIFASGAITLTLPPAKTQKGMVLFIKNVCTSTVSVTPCGTDTIEKTAGKSCSPLKLGKQYDNLTLISNGSNEWFIQSGVKCGAVLS